MVVHPYIHLEIARQRQQDLVARAERHRIANARNHAAATPRAWRRLMSAWRPASKTDIPRHLDCETGLEV